jgi:hypothetical protein
MYEKQEKTDEKEMQKHDEKAAEEKNWDEKWRRDPLGTLIWALIFIWAGVILLASNMGFLDDLLARISYMPGVDIPFFEAWPLILLGAGVLVLIEVLVRVLVPAYRKPITGTLILAVILIGIGLGDLFNWNLVWPLILIVLGASILFRGLFKPRE